MRTYFLIIRLDIFSQESKVIRLWPINLFMSPVMIHKITPSLESDWIPNEATNQSKFNEVPKVVKPTKKTLIQTLGCSVIIA